MRPPMAPYSMSWMLISSLVLLSQVQGEKSEDKVSSPGSNCPKGAKAFGSYCYFLFRTPRSWYNADGNEPDANGWEWSNDDILDYFNWERNPATATDRGYCGSLSRTSAYLKWRDYNCNTQLPYVCKFRG
uniref:C-type lectin domain-containing protein n=1 Tax=Cavia porcellus TaxID=10141 RepID=A0A286XMR7_CAVPO